MKRVISVTLNGEMFMIEEDAYICLKNAIGKQADKNEAERLVAERLKSKLSANKTIITYLDVLETLNHLDFRLPDSGYVKRLYRQPRNKILGGVCTGLGEYFGIDPVIIRIAFIVSTVFAFAGVWTYILFWIVIPQNPDA
jgi:phage shock protein PspC (stress-responsive transcriptional regulator)